MKSLSSRLKEARERKKLKQIQVKEKTGINNKTLSGYENGVSEPDAETLRILANLYEVSIDWLLGNESKNNNINTKKEAADKLMQYLEQGLTNEEIRQRMDFFVDIMKLSDEQVDEFMSFVRWQLSKKKEQHSAYKSEEQ